MFSGLLENYNQVRFYQGWSKLCRTSSSPGQNLHFPDLEELWQLLKSRMIEGMVKVWVKTCFHVAHKTCIFSAMLQIHTGPTVAILLLTHFEFFAAERGNFLPARLFLHPLFGSVSPGDVE